VFQVSTQRLSQHDENLLTAQRLLWWEAGISGRAAYSKLDFVVLYAGCSQTVRCAGSSFVWLSSEPVMALLLG
jgi:hypothetical protein